MADKKKKKSMTLSEAKKATVSPRQEMKLDRGYMNYRKKRILEGGGEAATAPKNRWMDIWKGSKKYK